MCGIHAAISKAVLDRIDAKLEKCLRNRGPDHLGTVDVRLDKDGSSLHVALTATVLALRGDHVAAQPLVDDDSGAVLCWNGEAWKIRGEPVQGNDGEAVLALLSAASKLDSTEAILDVMRSIEGPFAFLYLDKPSGVLYYGRDRLGRRSLLVHSSGDTLQLSSIAQSSYTGWTEVEADGCYTLSLDPSNFEIAGPPTRHAWAEDDSMVSSIGVFNSTIPEAPLALTDQAESVQELRHHLVESLRLRVLDVPVAPSASQSDARVAVLFSGGLDCTVLASLASDLVPKDQTIDLLNVAFENPRIAVQHKDLGREELYEMCPDRITGRKSFAELIATAPERNWRLVTVNVPYADTLSHRDTVVDLIAPHNTEMDLSIAYALYFAARGLGLAQCAPDSEPCQYTTTSRVLLSGLGADELFGGYLRHDTVFQRQGYQGLIDELKLDVGRLGKRNLGRDDRVMSHWSREVRFPYLDEAFVRWAIQTPVWQKCDFGNETAVNDPEPGKRILRFLAKKIGLGKVAKEKKRAIQFGVRTAKMESGRTKGTTLISPG